MIRSAQAGLSCEQISRKASLSGDQLRRKLLGAEASAADYDLVIQGEAICKDASTGRVVFRLCKNALAPAAVEIARECWSDIDEREPPSLTRRAAAGKLDVARFQAYRDDVAEILPLTETTGRLRLTNGRVLRQPMSNPVHSYMAGYSFERFGSRARPTLLTHRYPERWHRSVPFFRAIDSVLARNMPDIHAKQRDRCARHPSWTIPGTALSTVTININYVSRYHWDVGDFSDGYSTLTVVEVGEYAGGFLVLPAYRVAIDVRERDVLLCQSHVDIHGNMPLQCLTANAKRVSFVTYLKHKLGDAYNRLEAPPATITYREGKRVR